MEQQQQQQQPDSFQNPKQDFSFGLQLQRAVKVTVVDHSGKLASGATLTFLLEDVHVGSATIGTEPVMVEFSTADGDLAVAVNFLGEHHVHVFTRTESQYTFELRSTAHFIRPARGLAECPNGKTGQPCVDCLVGGKQIRICS